MTAQKHSYAKEEWELIFFSVRHNFNQQSHDPINYDVRKQLLDLLMKLRDEAYPDEHFEPGTLEKIVY